MHRLLAAASMTALLLAGCTPDAASKAPAAAALAEPAAVAASAGAAPPEAPEGFQLSTLRESANYTVTAEIDPAILAFDPPLAWRLWNAANAEMNQLATEADAYGAALTEDGADAGETPSFVGYTLDIRNTATLVLDDVISVGDYVNTYTGGAHPNYFLSGAIYRKGEAEALPLSTFVSDAAAFNDLLVKALVQARIERGYEPSEAAASETSLRELLAPSAEVPSPKFGFLLAPSTEPGKIAGITVVFSPYDIGSYAEGSYEVTIPASDLAPILTPAWANRFGGAAVPGESLVE